MSRFIWLLLVLWLGSADAAAPKIMVLGDSLSAAYGIPVAQGWVSLLAQRLRDRGYPHEVINASVSGETTSGGLARLQQALDAHHPALVLVELGANDGLRGLPVKAMQQNLERIVAVVRKAHATPVLFEMLVPTNYGDAYVERFTGTFTTVASKSKVPLVPFFLSPIATDPAAFQEDGIHPRAVVQGKLLDAVWPTLEPLLKK
ncbi:MAG TPA: arylesterase [Solimonas sp.]|nr:arylesterase [Solimonas sp.]